MTWRQIRQKKIALALIPSQSIASSLWVMFKPLHNLRVTVLFHAEEEVPSLKVPQKSAQVNVKAWWKGRHVLSNTLLKYFGDARSRWASYTDNNVQTFRIFILKSVRVESQSTVHRDNLTEKFVFFDDKELPNSIQSLQYAEHINAVYRLVWVSWKGLLAEGVLKDVVFVQSSPGT